MDKNTLWSLRLGFSAKQSQNIQKNGLEKFLSASFKAPFDEQLPAFLKDDPKTFAELKAMRDSIKDDSEAQKKNLKKQVQNAIELRIWWIKNIQSSDFPLREKMTVFWHNHFVSTSQKVKLNYSIYEHNMILRRNTFGNFRTLTKEILQSNAMVRYLDNNDNRKGKINENLSRELLELFTLGIGNYSEADIKNGAKALAGLTPGENGAKYRPRLEDNDTITYFGKTGTFKLDEIVDIIFEQPSAPYLITRKILKWFLYDEPDESLVKYYGDYLKKSDFEIQPLLVKMFTEESAKNTSGTKIKDPLTYILQLSSELNANVQPRAIAIFLKQQGMDLFNQPNVKGWDGGRSWLTSQIFLQRNNVADLLCSGKTINRKIKEVNSDEMPDEKRFLSVKLDWNDKGDNLDVIADLSNRLLFTIDTNLQNDFEKLLKYDFNPKSPGADNAVLRLFNDMVKTPEFQLI
ncbi:MAG: DUF1800 domain-containing protein [Flavobacterium sp.]|uniref:DUF1800 domain-containing protein n=1 Tax=Flavobacterium sp. TaxID=239 RepID=UPI001213AA88|nr:DUF1800 domain-containing protein [Flavobacterium sp.]RZJ65284.1 MAG: DUF1800 domain-containing protein [Flavobacterium sp.]